MGKRRIALVVLLLLVGVGGAFLYTTYRAYHHVPDFYSAALTKKPEAQREASQELSSRVTMLYSDAQREGDWKALFTQDQINGWLAVDLVEKHGEMLPPNIHDPRVAITPEAVTLALRIKDESMDTVFSLTVEPYLQEPNVVAFRLRKARAGSLPIPMKEVLTHLTYAAEQVKLPIRWAQIDNDPVALLTIVPQRDAEDNELQLEILELHEREIFFSGRTVPASSDPKLKSGATLPSYVAREIYIRPKSQ